MPRYRSGNCHWCKGLSSKLEVFRRKGKLGQDSEYLCPTCYAIHNNALTIELQDRIDAGMKRAREQDPDDE